MCSHGAGFTMMELIIVVAIISVLGALVYPTYSDAVRRTYRSQIVVLLSGQAQHLERFYTKKGLYSGAQNLGSGNQHYLITHDLSDHSFLLTATRAEGAFMEGDACGNFTLSHTGLTALTEADPGLTVQQCWGN